MRRVLLGFTLLVVLATPAFGQDWCKLLANVAETIMLCRQEGVPMEQVMDATAIVAFVEVVIDAYDRPRFSTDELQRKAVSDFRDFYYLECVKALAR